MPDQAQILVVDDQRGVRHLLVDALMLLDIKADTASNGNEALARLTQSAYDLVILDMKMPGLSGLQVAVELHRHGKVPEIWLMTAYDDVELRQQAIVQGIHRQITKPFDVLQLVEDIRTWITAKQAEKALF
ncbi:response regulator [Heliophilum fasciatum]|uniref:Stage 0 sporulation protein A homolog n=1 Tax=Heliophilum fasciatum TaxID=35700 RepID=A0A4R2RQ44_9FIRM|nr:response regulator [Heliophilum fasciatum]MCW2277501.1 two-component system response regulator (stage 0 sporulation protein F) [Heliophilum fasciatum]TCP65208.1 response regulator receiver protein [Heliophilum fasciatum]